MSNLLTNNEIQDERKEEQAMKCKKTSEEIYNEAVELVDSEYANDDIRRYINTLLEPYYEDEEWQFDENQRSKIDSIKQLLENCKKTHDKYNLILSEMLIYLYDEPVDENMKEPDDPIITRKKILEYLEDDYFLYYEDLAKINEFYNSREFKSIVDFYTSSFEDEE